MLTLSLRRLDLQRICSANLDAAAAAAAVCAATENLEQQWRAVGITFVICFGVLIVGVIAAAAYVAGVRSARRSAAAQQLPVIKMES